MTSTPFDARVAALDAGSLAELMRGRHSVRAFTDRPIEGTVREALERQVAAENERAGLSVQLCLDAPGAFDGMLAHYGSFRNVRNHLALVGPAGPGLDEAVGYAGEKIVLLARALGLDSCCGNWGRGISLREKYPVPNFAPSPISDYSEFLVPSPSLSR